jgi:hypothetical protein
MATISDGTYVILNVANTALAMDSAGATDGNNANVWLYTRNDTDAQLVRVWTRTDGTRQLMFSATGKCVDVTNYNVAQGANVAQYTDNDSRAQKWAIVDTGETATYSGSTYNVFKIKLSSNANYLIEFQGTGTPTSGANLCIAGDESTSADQKWIFIPMNPVPSGTYKIRSKLNTDMVLEVAGGSMGVGAHVVLNGDGDGNHQVFWVHEYDAEGRAKITATHSMMLMEIYETNTASASTQVCQCGDYGGTDQMWVVAPNGIASRNGATVPCYEVHNYAAQLDTLCLDATGGNTSPGTYAQIWPKNNTDAQRWVFDPAEMLADTLPVPAAIRAAIAANTSGGTELEANNVAAIYPSWICDGTKYQCRFRYRTRKLGRALGDWGIWRSLADSTPANNGWGTIGSPNIVTGNTARKYSGVAAAVPAVDCVTYDYAEVQFEVRRFEADYLSDQGLNAHGNAASQTIRMIWMPTLTVSAFGWSPEGLTINYASDYARGGNTIVVDSVVAGGKVLCRGYQVDNQPYNGTVTIPMDQLAFVPDDGAAVSINMTIRTDMATATASLTGTLAYDANHGISINPTYTVDNYMTYATITRHITDACYLQVPRDGGTAFVPCEVADSTSTTITFRIVPPLNTEFAVCFASHTGSAWATNVDILAPIASRWYVWTWGDECAILAVGKDDAPSQTDDQSPESTKLITTGRSHPVFRFGQTTSRDLSISGAWIPHLDADGDDDALDRLVDAHHAIYRTPKGQWYRVAVTGVSKTMHPLDGYGDVTIKQEAETV